MDFKYTEEQEVMRAVARKFSEKEIAPVAGEYDEKDEFPWEIVHKLHEVGLLTIGVPEEYGGPGLDPITQALIAEELAFGDAGLSTTVVASNLLAANPVLVGGNDDQKRRFYNVMNEGKLAAFCLTEPGSGSDAASLSTSARREGDYYILNGTKQFITNAGVADIFTVFATTDKSLRHKGVIAFMVDAHTPGITIGKKENKMGIRTSDTCQISFEDVKVPITNRLGEEGEGWTICMKSLDISRPFIAAMAVGIAQAAYEAAVNYAKERAAFGKPIATFQAVQFMLADMAIEIEASRLLVHKACYLREQGQPFTQMASFAKAFAGDTGMKVTTDAVQIFGGYGYIKDYPVEKYMRDAKIMQIYEGTNQIQRVVIASNILR
ncbi:acyl-CoA dehydrogenase family protein [Desulfitobacterium metallireducens]|uniref:Acyl-CoA dehydrogenase n=1 Tax=Desulfitobacterium metallireducens DSM 15288 TaxID=871968 RepID=W0E9W1_9FIRM|nr:acyl-CoA dehydrogenase family protein [Desulfitobacterium metallireducens]AHF07552.1 acyl-CoA dehydrogenase [Desulfitobacterium metallireducens DSM 15288]